MQRHRAGLDRVKPGRPNSDTSSSGIQGLLELCLMSPGMSGGGRAGCGVELMATGHISRIRE